MSADILDDATAARRLDPGRMLEAVGAFASTWEAAYQRGGRMPAPRWPHVKNLIVAGMGGSGITGDMVRAALGEHAPVPIEIVKGYTLPAYADASTLVMAVSYSGDTEETLSVAADARERAVPVVAVTSGGRLQAAAQKHEWPLWPLEPGSQPRAALPQLAGTVLGGLAASGRFAIKAPLAAPLEARAQEWRPETPASRNPAKRWGAAVATSHPTAYGWGPMAVAALRFKCQVNENAKRFARAETLPEANHNDLVPWGASHARANPLMLLRWSHEPPAIQARFDVLKATAKKSGAPVFEFTTNADDRLQAVLEAAWFSDYVSVYAAFAQGLDPTPVDAIGALKTTLAERGALKDAERRLLGPTTSKPSHR